MQSRKSRIWAGFLAILMTIAVAPAVAAAPSLDQQVLFRPSLEQGYRCFRIPAVVRSARGSLLAFAEGRVNDCGDTGDIDLVLKRSTDGGKTWSPLRVINEGNGDTHGNPVPIVDRRTGRIVLISTYNKGRTDDKGCDIPCPRFPHQQYSDDDGLTWSAAKDISAQTKLPGWDSWYASGPVHGIQLEHGRHAGRLVFGVNGRAGHPDHVRLVRVFGPRPGQRPARPDGRDRAAVRRRHGRRARRDPVREVHRGLPRLAQSGGSVHSGHLQGTHRQLRPRQGRPR
jgi:sialidase-1